ncbi:MEDS domain-containing protein [Haloterrigena sp. SYSU A121-1]|uniref:MEDS domain-containing protein n=1 Tax=Haloterrigena gelatinilytica TaxID=2741724 RepID=A0A8J8GPG8_9EURY|nr:MEDS domain-containing protein [Haloterrigena gelatinilytica]NUB92182.1 MEDS domain-containing protein [Haloterrigena gelatinilytica]
MSPSHTETPDRFGLEGALETNPHRRDESGGGDHHDGEAETAGHLALIYDTRDERLETVVPFLQQGLERGERCLYVADGDTPEEVRALLREGGIDVAAALDAGTLVICTESDTYLQTGEFDPDEMIERSGEIVEEATAEYPGLRVTAEATWVLDEWTRVGNFMEYESRANDLFRGEDCLVLCQYDRTRFPESVLADVIRTHPLVVSDGIVARNEYYSPPTEFLGTTLPSLDVERTLEEATGHARAQYVLDESNPCDETVDAITDEETFSRVLSAVLRAGYENDIALERSYVCRNGPPYPDWDVTIHAVGKPPSETPDTETAPDTLTDEETFRETLNAILRAGYESDLDLASDSFACRNEPPYPDWDVTVHTVYDPPTDG